MIKKSVVVVFLVFNCSAAEQPSSSLLRCLVAFNDRAGQCGFELFRQTCRVPCPLQCCTVAGGCICCCAYCFSTIAVHEVSQIERRGLRNYITNQQPKRNE